MRVFTGIAWGAVVAGALLICTAGDAEARQRVKIPDTFGGAYQNFVCTFMAAPGAVEKCQPVLGACPPTICVPNWARFCNCLDDATCTGKTPFGPGMGTTYTLAGVNPCPPCASGVACVYVAGGPLCNTANPNCFQC